MTNDIVKVNNVMQSMSDIERAAAAMQKSGFFADVTDISKAVVKILAGQEIGIGAFASMTGIHIIKGKPTYGANIIAAKIKSSGKYDYHVDEMTEQVCKITFLQNGKEIGQSVFTISDAKKAGTQNTDKFPRNMLFARAISNGYRWYCPDVTFVTMYTPEEFGAEVDDSGDITNAEVITWPKEVVSVDVVNQEVHYDSAQPAPKKQALKTNEIITDAEWAIFQTHVAEAEDMSIKLPEYIRAKMTASTLNGTTQYIKQQLAKVGK